MDTTDKWGLPYIEGTDIGSTIDATDQAKAELLDDLLTPFDQGDLGARPASTPGTTGIAGRTYRDTSTGAVYLDYGTGWIELATAATAGVFKAYRATTDQVIPVFTTTAVVFNAEAFDVSGWFDTSTGRFTPQIPGYYDLSWGIQSAANPAASDSQMSSLLRKGGASEALGHVTASSTGARLSSVGSAVVRANGSTDYFDVAVAYAAATFSVLASTGFASYFCGHLIGRS